MKNNPINKLFSNKKFLVKLIINLTATPFLQCQVVSLLNLKPSKSVDTINTKQNVCKNEMKI